MKKNSLYRIILMIFFCLCGFVLKQYYPNYQFIVARSKEEKTTFYDLKSDHLNIDDYFANSTNLYGGSFLTINDIEINPKDSLILEVMMTNNKVISHPLEKVEDNLYAIDILTIEEEDLAPQTAILKTSKNVELAKGDFTLDTTPLFHGYDLNCAYQNIAINKKGIFFGDFSLLDSTKYQDFDQVIVEICHKDETKAEGYELLGRISLPLETFLETKQAGFSKFLNGTSFDASKEVTALITFQNENERQTIALDLVRGEE